MEIIELVQKLVLIIAICAFVVGFIKLFLKDQRAKGKRILLYSIIAMLAFPFVGAGLDGIVSERKQATNETSLNEQARNEGFADYAEKLNALDKQAQTAGYVDYAAQKEAERLEILKIAEVARSEALNGFPDEEAQATAQSMGIVRYEAYKQRNNKNTISRYCSYIVEGLAIEKAKHAAMDKTSSDAKQTEIWDEYEALQQQLLAKHNKELGLQEFELVNLANAGNWRAYCNAKNINWSVLTEEQAKAATRADAKEAEEALNAFYLWNLNKQATTFFNQDIYSAVSCNWHNLNSMRFVGCQLISLGHKSNWQMFVVGRLANGNLAVSPINGDTSEKLNTADARFYDGSTNKRVFVQAYDQPRAYLANFAGPLIDIQDVRTLFE